MAQPYSAKQRKTANFGLVYRVMKDRIATAIPHTRLDRVATAEKRKNEL